MAATPTGMVCLAGSVNSTRARTYSFQTLMVESISTVTMPGLAMGTMMRHKIPK